MAAVLRTEFRKSLWQKTDVHKAMAIVADLLVKAPAEPQTLEEELYSRAKYLLSHLSVALALHLQRDF